MSVERRAVLEHDQNRAVVDKPRNDPEQPEPVGDVPVRREISVTKPGTAATQGERHDMVSFFR